MKMGLITKAASESLLGVRTTGTAAAAAYSRNKKRPHTKSSTVLELQRPFEKFGDSTFFTAIYTALHTANNFMVTCEFFDMRTREKCS